MPLAYPGADTPTPSFSYPAMVAHAVLQDWEWYTPQSSPKLCARVVFQILAPQEYSGAQYSELYFLGTDEDPHAQSPSTWSSNNGCKLIAELVKKIGVPQSRDLEADLNAARGGQVILQITKRRDKNDIERNNVRRHYQVGERNPELLPDSQSGSATSSAPAPGVPGAMPSAPGSFAPGAGPNPAGPPVAGPPQVGMPPQGQQQVGPPPAVAGGQVGPPPPMAPAAPAAPAAPQQMQPQQGYPQGQIPQQQFANPPQVGR